jgi:Copper type II ascorbate-dependent monooxygenase, C-terminal domain
MRDKALFLSTILLFATACGSSVDGGNGGSGSDGGSNAGTGGTQATSTTGTGNAGTGGGNPDLTGKTVTLTMEEFDVGSGQEVYKCQNFANPFDGDVEIGAFESQMTEGSHHLLLFYEQNETSGPIEDCSGLEFAATPYGTQQPSDTLSFPEGIAAKITKGTGFRIQSHYLNTGAPVHAHVEVTFHLSDPAKVKQNAAVLFVIQPDINIAPHSTGVVSYDCNLPQDMNILRASSHMHQHGTKFTSTLGGKEFYDTKIWKEPQPDIYTPPVVAKAGDPLHFQCTFDNESADTLTFGESAKTNEMCILTAAFYPALDGQVTTGCTSGAH